jgi:TraY domain-containing protein
MSDDKRRPFGAPPKREPQEGERFQLGLRVTAPTKRRLNAAAERSGRSLSQEAELRLERTFDQQDLLPEILTLRYGREVAALLIMLGRIAADVGHSIEYDWRLRERTATSRTWFDDPDAYDEVVEHIGKVLESLRPGPPTGARSPLANAGVAPAEDMLGALRGDKRGRSYQEDADMVRNLLRWSRLRLRQRVVMVTKDDPEQSP